MTIVYFVYINHGGNDVAFQRKLSSELIEKGNVLE